ncbi:hypothetical protein ABR737_01550 [Streptomyces sp. Edi2]|uniref:hypothetical protein n=1 Tax=Streptomyces sp. Edi2 TaxID=3162528 RepID=UPI0033061D7C
MKPLTDIRAAFAALPEDIDTDQIAEATGRQRASVLRNWAQDPTFPSGTRGPDGTRLRKKKAVLAWIEKQPFAQRENPPGPRNLAERARALPPLALRLSVSEMAEVLGVVRQAVNYYAANYRPGTTDRPFPAADGKRRRSWPEVRAWILDQDPQTAEQTPLAEWLAAQLKIRTKTAEALLTDPQAAEGAGLVEQLATRLGIGTQTAEALLKANVPALVPAPARKRRQPAPGRMLMAPLARAVGIGRGSLYNYASNHTLDSDDPFPAADDDGARDLEEVRAWLTRHGKNPT